MRACSASRAPAKAASAPCDPCPGPRAPRRRGRRRRGSSRSRPSGPSRSPRFGLRVPSVGCPVLTLCVGVGLDRHGCRGDTRALVLRRLRPRHALRPGPWSGASSARGSRAPCAALALAAQRRQILRSSARAGGQVGARALVLAAARVVSARRTSSSATRPSAAVTLLNWSSGPVVLGRVARERSSSSSTCWTRTPLALCFVREPRRSARISSSDCRAPCARRCADRWRRRNRRPIRRCRWTRRAPPARPRRSPRQHPSHGACPFASFGCTAPRVCTGRKCPSGPWQVKSTLPRSPRRPAPPGPAATGCPPGRRANRVSRSDDVGRASGADEGGARPGSSPGSCQFWST